MNVWECMYLIMIMIPEKRLLILLLVINKITINLIWFDFDLIWCGWTEGIAYVLPSTWDVDKNAVMVFGKEAVKTGCIERLQLDQPNNKWDQDNLKRCWARVERKTGLWISMKWACRSVNSVRLKQILCFTMSGPHHYIWYIES